MGFLVCLLHRLGGLMFKMDDDPHHRIRMSVKPGITGMWQVSGRSEITDFEEVVALDQYYIEHWSLWLDIKILVKTVMVVLKHEGAV